MEDSPLQKYATKSARYSALWLITASLLWFESFHRLYTHRGGEQISHGWGLFDGFMLVVCPIVFIVHLRVLVRSKKQADLG
jgi:hypothetical protein